MKRQSRRIKRAEQLVGQQITAYKQMVEVGIRAIERWSNVTSIEDPHLSMLQCMGAFLDASHNSKTKPAKSKAMATAVALRAAYLYGLHNGRYPKTQEPPQQQEAKPRNGV